VLFRYKQGLVDLFRRVHELRDDPVRKRLLALEIQEDLLRRIGHAEQRLRRTRFTNNALKCQLAKRAIDYQTVREIQTRYAAGEKKIGQQKELILTLRTVGDSIAFIYADRWDLKQFVWHEDSGFITGKRGTRLERQVLRRAFGIGAAAVLNDLTHTLRHGDITVFRDDGKFLVVELKSGRGGNRSRTERQLRASKRIMDYLSTDVREEEDGIWLRVDLAEAPLHHCVAITRLITTLPRAGWLVEEVEPGLHYFITLWSTVRAESHILTRSFNHCRAKSDF